ncbi:hypothetical protein [Rhodococcus sp. RS1C4]|nr:hypothetical protein [Rhodococcus sp. RS1C4]
MPRGDRLSGLRLVGMKWVRHKTGIGGPKPDSALIPPDGSDTSGFHWHCPHIQRDLLTGATQWNKHRRRLG